MESKTRREGTYKRTKTTKILGKGKNIQGQPVTVVRETYTDKPIKKKAKK